MSGYILSIDQSTQGTKAVLFDEAGALVRRVDVPHRQIINGQGWVSHDPMEIYHNLLEAAVRLIRETGIPRGELRAMGISNQRETTVLWDAAGKPLQDAVVWQCARAAEIARRHQSEGQTVYTRTGLPLSPYFPACKMAWLLENTGWQDGAHLGTMDSWLIYKLTNGKSFRTDYSNASRTQLFNIHTLRWDAELCALFGIPMDALPEVCGSDSCFGYTDLDGFLDAPIPIHAVLGDSHAALYGQGCCRPGMVKATYGTGSSIMMNIGQQPRLSSHGLATSLAWGIGGKVDYVLEGNINYTGAVITWLKDSVGLIQSPGETEALASEANPADTTLLIPAFSGLGAPHWNSEARAMLCNMTRTTGRAEIVKAGLESIAYQIHDVLTAMRSDCGTQITELRVDGGPTRNGYLMQFQSDLSNMTVRAATQEELSAIGAAFLAGTAVGLYESEITDSVRRRQYLPAKPDEWRTAKERAWQAAVRLQG